MLLYFSIENWYSFRDNNEFVMLTDPRVKTHKESCIKIDKGEGEVLRTTGIIGPNVSGKTNLFKILDQVGVMLLDSEEDYPDEELNYNPYALDKECKKKPSKFSIFIDVDGMIYGYKFSFNKHKIIDESFGYYPESIENKSEEIPIFVREKCNDFYFSEDDPNIELFESIVDNMNENQLFLAKLAQAGCEEAEVMYDFLAGKMTFYLGNQSIGNYAEESYYEDKGAKEFTKAVLKLLDPTLVDFTVKREKIEEYEGYPIYDYTTTFKHDGYELSLYDESSSIVSMYNLLMLIQDAIAEGGVLCIGDLNEHLNPKNESFIVNIFNEPKINKNNAQLIFTSTTPSFISNPKLRTDQIWILDKDDDGSHLCRLSYFPKEMHKLFQKSFEGDNEPLDKYLEKLDKEKGNYRKQKDTKDD